MDAGGSMMFEDCFGSFSFDDEYSDQGKADFENETMQKEISRYVEEVVRGIWSSVEHENACQEIRNFMNEFQQFCSFEMRNDKVEQETICHTSKMKERESECSTLENSCIDCLQDEDTVLCNAEGRRQDSDVVRKEQECSLELIFTVFQHWMSLIQVRHRQIRHAFKHHIKHKQRQCLSKWIQVFRRIKAEKIVQFYEAQKREYHRLQIAIQFHILYQTQKHFQAWIVATQDSKRKKLAALALEQELERERNQLKIADKYRCLVLLRQFLLLWKLTSNETKRQQEIEEKASLLKQKIQERIQQEHILKTNKKFKKVKESAVVHSSVNQETLEEGNVSTTGLKDINQEKSQSVSKPQVFKKGGANRHAEISLENRLNAQLNQLAEMHNTKRICKRFGWLPWRRRMETQQQQLEQASFHYSKRKLKVVFFEWKMNILPKRWSAVVLEIDRHGRALQFWRTHTLRSFVLEWRLVSLTEVFRRQHCKERVFVKWKRYREHIIELEAFAADFFETTLKRKSLTMWSLHFHAQVAAQEHDNSIAEDKLRDRLNKLKLNNRFTEWKLILQDKRTCQRKRHTLDKVMHWIKEHKNNKIRKTNTLKNQEH